MLVCVLLKLTRKLQSRDEIKKLQSDDENLVCYVKCGSLPSDDRSAKKVVFKSKNFELIDGLLHHEDPACPGRWCLVVPKELRSQLLEEAHAGLFAGHFSERKVYKKIRRLYWWPGLRRDVQQFCRSCLGAERSGTSASSSIESYTCQGTLSSCGC
jgi:hypothetical protein